jgi:UDP-3-O-acyl-N-acetylglucosamine deacetylase
MTEPQAFRDEIAPARTFGFVDEIRALESAGLGQGGKLTNFILIGESGIVNTELRFPEELARHKILDLVGDLYLLGRPLRAAVYARKTGHSQNVAMVRKLREVLSA